LRNHFTNFVLNHHEFSKSAKLFSSIIIIFTVINTISILPDIYGIYSKYGFVNADTNKVFISSEKITLNYLTDIIEKLGINYQYSFISVMIIYMASLIMILFNYWQLFFSVLALVLHTIFLNSTYLLSYGADFMINFLLYVNIFFCLKQYLSEEVYNRIFSFTVRTMQIQLCVIYFFGGFGKSLGYDWYTGDAIWLSLNHYINEDLFNSIIDYIPKYIYQIFSLGILFLELLYPFLIYNKKTTKATLTLIILMHIAISLIIGLHTFALAMILFNLIAFYPKGMINLERKIQEKLIMT
jgi:hypothetical protein